MDFWVVSLFCLFVLLSSLVLIGSHAWAWRAARREELDPAERDFRRRQFRRRVQTSGMLGVMAVAVGVGRWMMTIPPPPLVVLAYWGGVLVLLGWLALLAAADVLATKQHYRRMRDHCLVEQVKLQAELRRLQAVRGNGRAARGGKGPPAD